MVAIAPFRALRFAPGRVDLSAATSPPHDCMTPAEATALAAACPQSIVPVILPPERAGDGERSKHERANAVLQAWIREGLMARDAKPAFYRYEIHHGPPEDRRVLQGFFARVRLDPTYTQIRRHEKTLQRRKRDRLWLREATQTDTEAIWLLYRDTRGWVDEILSSNALEEVARCSDPDGNEHRLWRVDRPEAVAEVVAQFDDRSLVIADGHHRYQTALDHRAATGEDRHGSILACLVRDTDPGTSILATHRLVHAAPFGLRQAVDKAALHWDATELRLPADEPGQDAAIADAVDPTRTDLVLVGADAGQLRAWRLRLRPNSGLSEGRGRLDALSVSLAHERLLRDCWSFDLEHPEQHLSFTRDTGHALREVREGRQQFAVLLPPEPVAAVLEVAQQGHVMPQKSTYFVPKIRSGLVLGPLDEPLPRTDADRVTDPGKAEFRRLPLS